ncbi:polysaccharide pyruvyl transferase family protein [Solemya elarraichensis gill symbiont]|nr:polysaccharide pyruvyl transferase family protein [Solemya elarraichensis gill symbiont]
MNLAHFGTFDVQNFGDCLFPHIIEARLPNHNFFHVSPVGGSPWPDALTTMSIEELRDKSIDGVVIGGGNIISASRTSLKDYRLVSTHAYPTLWAGAAQLAIERDIPLVINAPGVMDSMHGLASEVARIIVNSSQYIAFRDQRSSALFCRDLQAKAKVIPDTVLEAARLLPKRLDLSNNVFGKSERIFVVHLKERNVIKGLDYVAKKLDFIAKKLEARPVLVAIGRCHNDEEIIYSIKSKMQSSPLILDEPNSLSEIVSSIISSVAYVGSSMHGFIIAKEISHYMKKTALSYGSHIL